MTGGQGSPTGPISVVEAVSRAIRAGDMATAKILASRGLAAGVEHPMLLNLRALGHEDAGRLDEALADLRRAHILAPQDYTILNACGLCLARLSRLDEAIECLDRALSIKSDFGPAWYNRGWALERTGDTAQARDSYARSVEIHPENVQGWANLAHLAARRGDVTETRRLAGRALELQPGHPTAVLALAAVGLSEPEVAERHLLALLADPGLSSYDQAMALGQLGDVLDAANRPAEAFAAYTKSNALFRARVRARHEAPGQETLADTMNWMIAWAESLTRDTWRVDRTDYHDTPQILAHVFMIGFPRSGTTLAESLLTNHPDVISLEEKNTLDASITAFLRNPQTAARLAAAETGDLRALREDYWSRVRSFGVEPNGKFFVDKHPLNTIKVSLIYKLFPNAKIIFCMRDPRDVVFSCFRRRFDLNASMYEFLDLSRTVRLYDRTMHLAEVFRGLQAMAEHRLVYERLVGDFETEARALFEFIGAPWRAELTDFAARARNGGVASASSAQIARGLYTDGIGHWRRYREQLTEAVGALRPWIDRFGYPAE